MRLNVGGKLWLAFFVTLTLTVLAMYLLLHNSLKRSFLDYTSQRAVQRLDILQEALVNIHRDEGSFQLLQQSPLRWIEVKSIIFSEAPSSVSGAAATPDRPEERYYRDFVKSISLFDSEQRLLLGVIKPNKTLSWIPLQDGKELIGFIGFNKPEVVVRSADQRFMAHQLKFFGILSIVVLMVSIAVATLLTRRISRPIRALSKYTELLAAGDYQQRIPVVGRDEIGQLSENFNQLAKTLAANEQSRANWVADISHEMRTPLAVLKAQIEAMLDGVRPVDKDNLSLLQRKVTGLNTLVDDLFELSLSDLGALNYQMHWLEFDRLTALATEPFQAKAKQAGLELRTTLPSGKAIEVYGDGKRLEQLLSNLLENAIRYTHAPGVIEVVLKEGDRHIELLVQDSAPGVEPAERQHIFERLYRLEQSRNRNTGGAGLGLAICKNIVEAHQGSICAEDSPLGGVRIKVMFPRKRQS